MSLPLLHDHENSKKNWAECHPNKLLRILKDNYWPTYPAVDWMGKFAEAMRVGTKGTPYKRKIITHKENDSKALLTQKQKEEIISIWDLRSAAFEWGAAKVKEISGARPYEPCMHIDMVMTLKAFTGGLEKGSMLDTIKEWEGEYLNLYSVCVQNEGTALVWCFIQDSKEKRLPSAWVEELHRFSLRWPYKLEIQQALDTMKIAAQGSMEEAKSLAKNDLGLEFDDRRFSLGCMMLDHFDISYRSKMKKNESLKGIRFTGMDLAKLLDFKNSIQKVDFGGAMPVIDNWFQYCRGALDLDKHCLGYAWDFIAFSAFRLDGEAFIWIWDVDENFNHQRLEKKIATIKPFRVKLQELFKERFPDGLYDHDNLGVNEEAPNSPKESHSPPEEVHKSYENSESMAQKCQKKEDQPKGNILSELAKEMKGKNATGDFEDIFKGWIDEMANQILLYGGRGLGGPSEPMFDYELGPFEIAKEQLGLVLTRFAVILNIGKGIDLPLGLTKRLEEVTVLHKKRLLAALEALDKVSKRENIDILLVVPQSIRASNARLPLFKVLAEIIFKATKSKTWLSSEPRVGPVLSAARDEKSKESLMAAQPEKICKQDKSGQSTLTNKPVNCKPTQSGEPGQLTQSKNAAQPNQPDKPVRQIQLDEPVEPTQPDSPNTTEKPSSSDKTDHVDRYHTYLLNQSSALILNTPTVSAGIGIYKGSPSVSTAVPTATLPHAVEGSLQTIMNYSRHATEDIHALNEENYSLRALVTVLIDGDALSRRNLMERGHQAVPFAQLRTDPTLDRSSVFSDKGPQYEERFVTPRSSESQLKIDDEEYYS